MSYLFYILIFIFGTAVGSFLNVVIDRCQTGESIIRGRSYCPKCRAILRWYDLIPLFSFLILRGRCRYCRGKISWQYPIVELATGVLFVLVSVSWMPDFNLDQSRINSGLQFLDFGYWLFIVSCLIVIFVYDLKHYIIPDKIIYPAIILALIFNFQFLISNQFSIFKYSILSASGAAVFFLTIVLISRGKWMGLGDVKFAALMGLVLGWPDILLALFLAFLSGALVGLSLIAVGSKTLKSQIPFGPFLSAGTIFVMLFGSQIIAYLLYIGMM